LIILFFSHCFCVSFWCDSCFASLSHPGQMADNGTPWLKSVLLVSHNNWYLYIYLCNSLLFLPSLNLFSNSHLKMDTTIEKIEKYFPALPPNAITKLYRARCARLMLLMNHGILEDICWLIEAKVWLSGESSNSFISYMPGTDKTLLQRNIVQNDWKSVIDVPDRLVMHNVIL
jgi:hypothetical protein